MEQKIAELQREYQSSIELQRAKDGTYYWSIKLYFDMHDLHDIETATTRLSTIDYSLRSNYLTDKS